MFVSLFTAVFTGVLGNAISDKINEKRIENKIEGCYRKAEKDFYKKYKDSFGDKTESFLTRRENVQLSVSSILRIEDDYKLEKMNPESYKYYDKGTVEAINYFSDLFRTNIMEDSELRRIVYENHHYNDQKQMLNILKQIYNELAISKETKSTVDDNVIYSFIDELSTVIRVFKEELGIDLLLNNRVIRETQLKTVTENEITFVSSLSYIETLINDINHERFNRYTNVNESNKIKSLEYFLKRFYHEDSFKIDAFVSRNLENIKYVISGYRNVKDVKFYKALNELSIDNINSYVLLWEKLLISITEVFKQITSIIVRNASHNSDEQFQRLTKESIKSKIKRNISWDIGENEDLMNYLKYVLDNDGRVIDTELAVAFSKDVKEIRQALYPLLDSVILYNYNTMESTKIFINDNIKDVLLEVIDDAN